jgi:hypothetical protein
MIDARLHGHRVKEFAKIGYRFEENIRYLSQKLAVRVQVLMGGLITHHYDQNDFKVHVVMYSYRGYCELFP